LAKFDAGWVTLEGTLNVGRAAVAAEFDGCGRRGVHADRRLLCENENNSDGLIGEFQALQHRAANLYCELEVSRSAVLKALQMLDESFESAGAIVSVAKAKAGQSANARGAGSSADARRNRDDRRI